MKRFFLMWGLVIALLLSGCGSSASRVETLKSWSFQYNEGTSDYSLPESIIAEMLTHASKSRTA